MAAGRRDIEITKGDDYSHVVYLKVKIAGVLTAVDITGNVYTAQLRKSPAQDTADATFVCVVTDALAGEITLSLSHTITAALPPDCYQWDLQQNAGGILNTLLRGRADVSYDVTR